MKIAPCWPPAHDDQALPAQDAAPQAHFDALYAADDDPWRVRERWYEHRKRALLLAALPRPRFVHAFEPACGNGELSAALAARCDGLLASDASPRAVELSRRRLAAQPNATVVAGALPQDWPRPLERFDLVVFSELGYYLSAAQWRTTLERCMATLAPDGVIVACHFRPDCGQRQQPTAEVHAAIDALTGLVHQVTLREPDFLLDVWTRDGRSVAQREGLR